MKTTLKFFIISIFLATILMAGGITLAQNSVLSTGTWRKIMVYQTGVHKISYSDLESYGFDVSQINPRHIRIYGNGNGMLPEANDGFRFNDLQQNAIFVHGENDGVFDVDDYILFYAEGAVEWRWNEERSRFEHTLNLYSNHSCFFINADLGEGQRIGNQASLVVEPDYVSTSFDDYMFHEEELQSILQSGKTWYGEEFDEVLEYNFEHDFPNLIASEPVHIYLDAAYHSSDSANFYVSANNQSILSIPLLGFPFYVNSAYAKKIADSALFFTDNSTIELAMSFDKPNSWDLAWLNYFTLSARRQLVFESGQMQFRDTRSVEPENITLFQVSTLNPENTIWNISDPINPSAVSFDYSGAIASFILQTDSLLQFVIFDGTQYFTPEYEGEVENQNLHACELSDMLIITHADFLPQAQQLADFRESHSGISCYITTPEKIYNEYSSGVKDVSAIRDFVKNVYERCNGEKPKYLLLFGDASFDYKNISGINTVNNYVDTWESSESLHPINSYCSDDFFGIFDDFETGFLKIAIGRLPAKTPGEATAIIEKIIHYQSNAASLGKWRNKIVLIADDEDGNVHFDQSETVANYIDSLDGDFNIHKIYLDAFVQETFANGHQAFPDVNVAISEQINEGVGIINYVGHGFYLGLAHEKVLWEDDLLNWNNPDFYPMMFTASCSFGHFDNPEKYSITEQALLMEGKGMSAVISATRLNFGNSNHALQMGFYSALINNPDLSLGAALTSAKNQMSGINHKKFILFGDPAMRLTIPKYKICTEAINGLSATLPPDTLRPGEQILATGFLTDREGNKVYNFTGTLNVEVFDKARMDTTLGNDYTSNIAEFSTQDSVLLNVEAEVFNGQFALSFRLPENMDEKYGKIKLSYYATDGMDDATGYYSECIVGGQASDISEFRQEKRFINFYPTPIETHLFFHSDQQLGNVQIEILDISGNMLYLNLWHSLCPGEQHEINVAKLPKGLYIVRAYTPDKLNVFKIIKQ